MCASVGTTVLAFLNVFLCQLLFLYSGNLCSSREGLADTRASLGKGRGTGKAVGRDGGVTGREVDSGARG